jgi:hypothetical protein
MIKTIVLLFFFFFLDQLSLMRLLQSAFLCLGDTPWAPPRSWPCAWSNAFSFLQFLAPRVLYNLVFCVNRIFHNPSFCVSQIFHNPAFHVSNTTRTSFFMLRVANPANPVNPANLICPSIRVAIWANLGSLANPICLPVRVAILANLVNPARVIRTFSLVCHLCSNACHPQVARPNHLTTPRKYHTFSLRVLPVIGF